MLSGPCVNRTRDQRIKSPLLYLTELTAHIAYASLRLVTLLAWCVKRIIQDCGVSREKGPGLIYRSSARNKRLWVAGYEIRDVGFLLNPAIW